LQVCLLVAVIAAPAGEGPLAPSRLGQNDARFSFVLDEQVESLRRTDPELLKRRSIFGQVLASLLMLVPALVAVAGGVRMYQLRSWPLALVGSLASTVPCLSAVSCCCAGEVVGVWCVAVLLRPEVRDAFR
jgi:hypothetical protein